jgi:hypothetical protein
MMRAGLMYVETPLQVEVYKMQITKEKSIG